MHGASESCQCENVVVRCMDFRFHADLPALLAEHFGVECFEYDSPGGCGGAMSLIDDVSRELILNALDLAISLHGVRRLVIVNHVDCGAYGGSERFGAPAAERDFHAGQLREARDIALQRHRDLEVVLFFQDEQGISVVE